MRRDSAITLVKDTLEQPFDKERFARFAKELLNRIEDAPFTYKGNLVFDDFRDHVDSLERIGKYQDADENKLDILIVRLKRASSVERARTAQRQFVAKYLKGSRGGELKDAALVAFVSPDEEDWRFSFVRMEYKIGETEKGRIRVKEEFTPARRYSFLVGKNENSHTAQSRLLPILEDSDSNPRLSDLEDAFSVEKVTKEFFEKYRELYLEIKEALDSVVKKDKAVHTDFADKGIETADFAKKLLGQIVFLYFLQKKGWFGVARTAAWGSGPKNFLRKLCSGEIIKYDNFFNDVLEPLFYEALATERPADWYNEFKCKIPFLNGGLFDPLNDYDWIHTDVLLPNDLFTNKRKTKQGDIGTGILDVFDRYNFTVKEDEPLEKEVAVDPEMLGKVFENLLEVKDRKSKGTYYTPREIVHYMCQESLINYLATQLEGDVPREDIITLVKHGESALENDIRVKQEGRETDRYYFKLPDSIRDHANVIDDKLADIKVCDPAVGSGAFLVGMMSEILRYRQVLTEFIGNAERRTAYDLKRHAIHNSLHGVDIDPSAVEIAKLRLWLSLVVDEQNYKQIQPLPNLDYKIMQGNSLLETYEGIKLIDERFLERHDRRREERERLLAEQNAAQREYIALHQKSELLGARRTKLDSRLKEITARLRVIEEEPDKVSENMQMWDESAARSKAESLQALHERYFAAYHKREKERLKVQIESLTWDLIETTLKENRQTHKLADIHRFKSTHTKPFFLWRLYFSEVYSAFKGFHVVIANPPYVSYGLRGGQPLTPDDKTTLKSAFPDSAEYKISLYAVFMDKAIQLASPHGGIQTFIVPDSFLLGRYFSRIRALILRTCQIDEILLLPFAAFDATVGYSVIYSLTRRNIVNQNHLLTARIATDLDAVSNDTFTQHRYPQSHFHSTSRNRFRLFFDQVTMNLVQKIEQESIPLGSLVKFSSGLIGKNGQDDIISDKALGPKWLPGIVSGGEIRNFVVHHAGNFLLYDKTRIKSGYDSVDYMRPKLLLRQTGDSLVCASDNSGLLCLNNVHVGNALEENCDLRVIVALLNSSLFAFYYQSVSLESGRTMAQIDIDVLESLPIRVPPQPERNQLTVLVDKAAAAASNPSRLGEAQSSTLLRDCQKKIDTIVYDLYGINSADISLLRERLKNAPSSSRRR